MPTISTDSDYQTVITTFEVTPGTALDLLETLELAHREFISHQPGFIAVGLHMNDAHTRIGITVTSSHGHRRASRGSERGATNGWRRPLSKPPP